MNAILVAAAGERGRGAAGKGPAFDLLKRGCKVYAKAYHKINQPNPDGHHN